MHNLEREREGERAPRKRDIGRKRKAGVPKKRLHLLIDPSAKAFPNWENVRGMWTFADCEKYIDWCHIGKAFPLQRHSRHRARRVANMKFCTNAELLERCIQVCQHLYNEPIIPRNEATISILRMVYAEVELGRVVDWSTMRTSAITKWAVPDCPSIPWTRKFPDGGLGKTIVTKAPQEEDIQWSDTSSDDDNTGCPTEVRSNIEQEFKGKWLIRALNEMAEVDEANDEAGTSRGPTAEAQTPMKPRSPRTQAYIAQLEAELRQCRNENEELRQCKAELEQMRNRL